MRRLLAHLWVSRRPTSRQLELNGGKIASSKITWSDLAPQNPIWSPHQEVINWTVWVRWPLQLRTLWPMQQVYSSLRTTGWPMYAVRCQQRPLPLRQPPPAALLVTIVRWLTQTGFLWSPFYRTRLQPLTPVTLQSSDLGPLFHWLRSTRMDLSKKLGPIRIQMRAQTKSCTDSWPTRELTACLCRL